MLGCTENIALLLLETMKFSVCPVSFGPSEMLLMKPLTVCAPESSGADWSVPTSKLGASLTAVTAMLKVCAAEVSTPPLAVPPLSWACTVTTALPSALAASV